MRLWVVEAGLQVLLVVRWVGAQEQWRLQVPLEAQGAVVVEALRQWA